MRDLILFKVSKNFFFFFFFFFIYKVNFLYISPLILFHYGNGSLCLKWITLSKLKMSGVKWTSKNLIISKWVKCDFFFFVFYFFDFCFFLHLIYFILFYLILFLSFQTDDVNRHKSLSSCTYTCCIFAS